MSRLQAAEFGGQPVLLLLQLLHLKSVLSEALLSLVGLFVVFQLALKAAVCPLQLGQLNDGNPGVKTIKLKLEFLTKFLLHCGSCVYFSLFTIPFMA